MGTKLNPGRFDCYAAAADDEPLFVLLGRDRHAPILVALWAAMREIDAECPDKIAEARDCAAAMLAWAEAHGRMALPEPNGAALALGSALAERVRQVDVEEWTAEHDDDHLDGSLAAAAAAYALVSTYPEEERKLYRGGLPGHRLGWISLLSMIWPGSWANWHFKPRDPRRDLVRAAALILAEIERRDRRAARVAFKFKGLDDADV